MQKRWMFITIAAMLVLGTTMALAQQTGGCVAVDTQDMTDDELVQSGYHYDPVEDSWYKPDDNAAMRDSETGRYVDTSFPDWSYDPAMGRWYDDARPGWSYDPLADVWYNEERPGEIYDLRTGRWHDEQAYAQYMEGNYDYDRGSRTWRDNGMSQERMRRDRMMTYYDPEMGRWRNQPMMGRQVAGMREFESEGHVRVRMWPMSLRPGKMVEFDVTVGPGVSIGADDTVTAYMTPDDSATQARYPVQIAHKGGRQLIGRADLTRKGDYMMVIRISPREGVDRVLHYPVTID